MGLTTETARTTPKDMEENMTTVWILWDANPYEAWDNNHRGIYATREAAVRNAPKVFYVHPEGSLEYAPTFRLGLERVLRVTGDGPVVAGFLERYEVKE